MPLSPEQRRVMDIHIKSNTVYNWHTSGTNSGPARTFIIDRVQRIMDSGGNHDLFLPNCFIECEASSFWFKIARIASDGVEFGWHELEYGPPISREDRKQRYVYTWTFKGKTFKFYTKTLNDGYKPDLVWYVCACNGGVNCNDGNNSSDDSGEDTESDEILLWVA